MNGRPGEMAALARVFVRRHPLTVYLLWFFIVGQAVAFVPLVCGAIGVDPPVMPFVIASTLSGLLLPAVVITWIVDGRAGVAALLGCAAAAHVGLGWYAVALVAAPLTAVGITVVTLGPPVDASTAAVASAVLLGLGLQTLLGFLTTNLAEEIAWMGFVQTRLGNRHGPLTAAVLTAPLFALQHLALVVSNAGAGAGALILLLLLILLAVPFRAWMAWLLNRSHSLVLVGLATPPATRSQAAQAWGSGCFPASIPTGPWCPCTSSHSRFSAFWCSPLPRGDSVTPHPSDHRGPTRTRRTGTDPPRRVT